MGFNDDGLGAAMMQVHAIDTAKRTKEETDLLRERVDSLEKKVSALMSIIKRNGLR